MDKLIKDFLITSAKIKLALAENAETVSVIESAALQLLKTVRAGGCIYICGNGGSACDSMHFCEELLARYKRERAGIKAQHLLDPAVLTCWGNDYDFESVFSRQVETLCGKKDTLVVLTTSGNSKNILKAVESAKKVSCPVIGLTGSSGGKLLGQVDFMINVPSSESDRIQETHITLIHIFCEILETAEYCSKMGNFSNSAKVQDKI